MSAVTLLDTLDGLGVRASVTAAGKLRLEPASLVPGELLDEVRASKAALLEVLSLPMPGDMLPPLPWEDVPGPLRVKAVLASPDPLPEHLALMVDAAKSGKLSRGTVTLASGLVPDLSVYVLAWAECWPGDRVHILRRLEEAYAVTALSRRAR